MSEQLATRAWVARHKVSTDFIPFEWVIEKVHPQESFGVDALVEVVAVVYHECDSKLIAAAPKMAEALRLIVEEPQGRYSRDPAQCRENVIAWMQATAREALGLTQAADEEAEA